jgi:hypothetical protein
VCQVTGFTSNRSRSATLNRPARCPASGVRDLERGPRQVSASDVNAIAHQRPAPPHTDVANHRRTPKTIVHRPDPRELATARLTGETATKSRSLRPSRKAPMHAEPTT